MALAVERARAGVLTKAEEIRALARRFGVTYTPAPTDAWAQSVTELAGDDVQLDEIELTLIALRRAGVITKAERVRLQAAYLSER